MSTSYRSLDDVVNGIAGLEARFRAQHDRRAIFATLYGLVSARMRDRVAAGGFEDNAWVHRYAVAFANLYRQAIDDHDAGRVQKVPKAWRLCFDLAKAGTGLVLTDMLLGVNAHVNHDLPYALNGISIEPDRQKRYRDHCAVNAVLGAATVARLLRAPSLNPPFIAACRKVEAGGAWLTLVSG